jgi:hypothetical protein
VKPLIAVVVLVAALAVARQPFVGNALRRLFSKTPPLNPEEHDWVTCDECNGTGCVLTIDRKRIRMSRLGTSVCWKCHGKGHITVKRKPQVPRDGSTAAPGTTSEATVMDGESASLAPPDMESPVPPEAVSAPDAPDASAGSDVS